MNVSPAKIVAVQRFETNSDGSRYLNGQGQSVEDPNTSFVPIQVTLPGNCSAQLQYPSSAFQVWSGSTSASNKEPDPIPLSAGSSQTTFTFYFEALQAGQFTAGLVSSGYISQAALFTAVGNQGGFVQLLCPARKFSIRKSDKVLE